LESKLNYYKYLKKYLETKVDHEDLIAPTVVGGTDQYLERLIEDISLLQKKQLELNMNLTEKLPPVSLQKENIEFTKKKLGENIENSIINIQVQINEEERKLKLVNIEMEKLPVTEKNLINIQRKFDINNTVYTYLLEKRAETGIAKASNVSNNKIVDQADYFNYTQIKPDKKKNQLKAFAISLLLPAVLILLLYYFNERIIDNTDIIRKTKVPVIGYISHSDEVKELPVYSNPSSSLSEGFRSIRTSLRYLIKDIEKPVIVITSTISSEGKTFMSANLAAITALSGKKVLLVGLDLRKPRIHKILGLENTIGLSNYLSNGCDYSEVIKKTAIENLDYATSGPVPPNPAELINEMKMKAFLDRAKADYDIVIIDTPPVAVVTDTFLLADYVDVNIFIVRQRYSSKNTLELIQEIYQNKKLKNMGIIINDISLSGYYGYGLRYGYYRGYGYSYGRNYYGKYSYSRYGYKDDDKGYYKKD
jgi:capsular exopolysaccharide synthesis family protein